MEVFNKILRNPLGIFGLILIVFWMGIAVFTPLIAPPDDNRDPYIIKRISYSSLPNPPGNGVLMGTTSGGYDIFYGIVWGSRTAFRIGLITVFCSAILGVLIGGISAYQGGLIDNIVMRVVDLFMGFPFLIAVIVMTIVLGKGIDKVMIALIIFGWRGYARIMRSEVLLIKKKEFVLAAKSIGASGLRVFLKHILPNAIYPVLVLVSLNIGRMVLLAASLSFIGVGSEPGYADWGQMVNFARMWIMGTPDQPFFFWYTYTFPSLAILSFVLGWTLLGDLLRDIYDPQMLT